MSEVYCGSCVEGHSHTTKVWGTCEMMAENGRFGGCFRQPSPPEPNPRAWPLSPFFRLSPAQAFQGFELPQHVARHTYLLTFSTSFLTTLLPSLTSSEGPILAPRALFPKWASLRSTCGSWLAVYMGLSSQLVFALASLLVLPLLSSALSHECTTISNLPCASSSTLDRACVPRRDISETGKISEGWLASAEP